MPGRPLPHRFALTLILALLLTPLPATAQGTLADYARANSLGERLQGLVVDIAERPSWIGETSRFWYRKTVEGGHNFVLVDAETRAKTPAFDHARLASTLSSLSPFAEDTITAVDLPFTRIEFTDDEQAIEFVATTLPGGATWTPMRAKTRARPGGRDGAASARAACPGRRAPASSGGT